MYRILHFEDKKNCKQYIGIILKTIICYDTLEVRAVVPTQGEALAHTVPSYFAVWGHQLLVNWICHSKVWLTKNFCLGQFSKIPKSNQRYWVLQVLLVITVLLNQVLFFFIRQCACYNNKGQFGMSFYSSSWSNGLGMPLFTSPKRLVLYD